MFGLPQVLEHRCSQYQDVVHPNGFVQVQDVLSCEGTPQCEATDLADQKSCLIQGCRCGVGSDGVGMGR